MSAEHNPTVEARIADVLRNLPADVPVQLRALECLGRFHGAALRVAAQPTPYQERVDQLAGLRKGLLNELLSLAAWAAMNPRGTPPTFPCIALVDDVSEFLDILRARQREAMRGNQFGDDK